jgi:uncharacterized membrane protein
MRMRETQQPVLRPTAQRGGAKTAIDPQKSAAARQNFVAMAINMGWQLAIAVLVPVIGGAELDKAFGKSYVFTLIGLGVALVGSGLVLWRSVQVANRLPVPKLTTEQKRAIKKSYEDEDDE